MPEVSIVIPVYNPGKFLREALESVHAQTFTDWEVIMIDDGSDECLAWVSRCFPKVTVERQANRGSSVARNKGILRASGEFIAFMDQDDVWRKEKLERQVITMRQDTGVGVCYCDLFMIGKEGTTLGRDSHDGTEHLSSEATCVLDPERIDGSGELTALYRSLQFFSQAFIVPSTVLVRRSALSDSGLLDPFIPFSGDYDMLIKLGARTKVVRVPRADVAYRKHDQNFSNRYDIARREAQTMTSRYKGYGIATGDCRLVADAGRLLGRPRRMYAAQAYDCARIAWRRGDMREFSRHLANAFFFSPRLVIGALVGWLRQ